MGGSADFCHPHDLGDSWPISTLDAVGLDPERLCVVVGWLDVLPGENVHSVLVVRKGLLAFEHYRSNSDHPQGPDIKPICVR